MCGSVTRPSLVYSPTHPHFRNISLTDSGISFSFNNGGLIRKVDATSGFCHLKLDEDSSKLTCFNTPYWRYRFLRAPFGIKSIPEIFQGVTTELMEDIEGAEVIVDDILIWGATIQEHDERLRKVLDRARQCNLKLSKWKCKFRNLFWIVYEEPIFHKRGDVMYWSHVVFGYYM